MMQGHFGEYIGKKIIINQCDYNGGIIMTIDYEFLYVFTKEVLKLQKSIRWVGITNKFGVLLNIEKREGVKLLLTDEENEEYAANTISRQKTRTKFEPKIGKLLYAFGKYQKLNRATIPINNSYFLLITLDVDEKDFNRIIMDKVIPLVEKEKYKFDASVNEEQ
jgi:hypothetical protein